MTTSSPRDFSAELAAARTSGDWTSHERIWDERNVASVEADEASIADALDLVLGAPSKPLTDEMAAEVLAGESRGAVNRFRPAASPIMAATEFTEPCPKCNGTGRWNRPTSLGHNQCTKCKGRGYTVHKTSPEARAANRASAASRKAAAAVAAVDSFMTTYPAVGQWLKAKAAEGSFNFAVSVWAALNKYGHLTDAQLEACARFMAADDARALAKEAKVVEVAKAAESANAILTTEALDNLMASLKQASAKGLKKPALRFEGFTVTMAGAASKNAGGLYLKDGGVYLGKIVDGKLTASWEAKRVDGLLDRIAAAMVDPVEAARAYGKRTGHCSCCGRLLTDPVSVEKGIGPICEENFF